MVAWKINTVRGRWTGMTATTYAAARRWLRWGYLLVPVYLHN